MWVKLGPFLPSPTTGDIFIPEVTQPVDLPLRSLSSGPDGYVWLTARDSCYSENLAYTYQFIATTGTSFTSVVTNVVANAMQAGYASPNPASSYAYHLQGLLTQRQIAWDFPLCSITGLRPPIGWFSASSDILFATTAVSTTSLSSYVVWGADLTADVTASVAGTEPVFEISTDLSTFGLAVILSPTAGSILQYVYVRYSPTLTGTNTGIVTNSSTNVPSVYISLTGSATGTPPIQFLYMMDNDSKIREFNIADPYKPYWTGRSITATYANPGLTYHLAVTKDKIWWFPGQGGTNWAMIIDRDQFKTIKEFKMSGVGGLGRSYIYTGIINGWPTFETQGYGVVGRISITGTATTATVCGCMQWYGQFLTFGTGTVGEHSAFREDGTLMSNYYGQQDTNHTPSINLGDSDQLATHTGYWTFTATSAGALWPASVKALVAKRWAELDGLNFVYAGATGFFVREKVDPNNATRKNLGITAFNAYTGAVLTASTIYDGEISSGPLHRISSVSNAYIRDNTLYVTFIGNGGQSELALCGSLFYTFDITNRGNPLGANISYTGLNLAAGSQRVHGMIINGDYGFVGRGNWWTEFLVNHYASQIDVVDISDPLIPVALTAGNFWDVRQGGSAGDGGYISTNNITLGAFEHEAVCGGNIWFTSGSVTGTGSNYARPTDTVDWLTVTS